MKKLYTLCSLALLLLLLCVGMYSLMDKDATFSASENRKLKTRPKLTISSLLDGSYSEDFSAFYADTFPSRESFLSSNRKLNGFYYFSGLSGKSDTQLVISGKNNGADHGEALASDSSSSEPSEPTEPSQPSTEPTQPSETTAKDPNHSEEPDPDTERYGTMVLVGDRATELAYTEYSLFDDYAAAVSHISSALGANGVTTYSMLVPNSAEFYTPEEYHTGDYGQKNMIDYCYSKMDASVKKVDGYSKLAAHTDEYIYFRTDHHWTQLGAYYAYTAFCEARGFKAEPLSKFETGEVDGFVGSMYTFMSDYPQSQILKDNPDTVFYYRPYVETNLRVYDDATLTNSYDGLSVISGVGNVSNKYLCFLGGDHPISVIDTNIQGPVCVLLKESYGNAFAPWLTSHYSKIIVIDPREFNRDGKPSLDLVAFAKEQGVTDCIVLNYPMMLTSSAYIAWLDRLVQ